MKFKHRYRLIEHDDGTFTAQNILKTFIPFLNNPFDEWRLLSWTNGPSERVTREECELAIAVDKEFWEGLTYKVKDKEKVVKL